ncbi:hypothetical protein FACS1894151_06030 [Spirochaetia bacterium]|nr:hypothetical protein FACS1894151_06030 [Spirochaetia bacterium]
MSENLVWKEESRKPVYTSRVFTVSERISRSPEGNTGTFTVLDTSDWAIVIPVLETPKGREFVMVRQWRHGSQELSLEFPGGVMEAGENGEMAARRLIEQSDSDRQGFHRYFFDVDWKDPGNYHLTLNTGFLSPSVCATFIRQLRDIMITPDVEALHTARLKELILGHQVIHHILYKRGIPVHFLEATVSNGAANLYGVANSQSLIEAAIAAAREVPEITSVRTEIQVVQEYNVMH